jgi:hypothetical protein
MTVKTVSRLVILLTLIGALTIGSFHAVAKEAYPVTGESSTQTHNYSNAGVEMSDQAFDKKVGRFRDDVLNGRKSAVSAAIAYPARAYVSKQKFSLRSSADLIRYYDKIFSRKMIQAIRAAKTHDLFSRDQGVMLGNGEVWFNEQAKVKAFNNM